MPRDWRVDFRRFSGRLGTAPANVRGLSDRQSRRESCERGEMPDIEGEEILDSVDVADRNQSRVMDLLSDNPQRCYSPSLLTASLESDTPQSQLAASNNRPQSSLG
jgi:hypothetical protein